MAMFSIVEKKALAPEIKLYRVLAPRVAAKALPGHFVVVRVDERGERIPLTIAGSDPVAGTITLVVQEVGYSTRLMGRLSAGDSLRDVLGPLGTALPIEKVGTIIGVGGGVGVAPLYPKVRAYKAAGNRVISIIGARGKDLLILEDEMAAVSDELLVATDDGTLGHHGLVTDVLREVLASEKEVGEVIAIGPVPMMRAACAVTKEFGAKTVVSLNSLMIDGTGMCGGCRVTVGGEVKFTCVDGPEFDGHEVDFGQLWTRLGQYRSYEKKALERLEEQDKKDEKEACQCLPVASAIE